MNIKFLLAMILSIFLVACGQGDTTQPIEDSQDDTSTEVISETEDVSESENESKNETEASDEPEEKENEDDAASETAAEEKEEISQTEFDDLKIHYMDVGQADATLFQYSDDGKAYTILYDTGDWRGNEVVNYLQAQNVSSIDLVVVSHPDADHIGQLDKVVNTFDVGEVWMSGNESSSQTFQRGIEAVLNSGADFHEPRTGEEYQIGPLEIDVLYPETISGKANEESVSLLFTYGSTKFLFTGDAGRSDELKMINSGIDIQADILQLGHHGSKTSSDPAFIEAVNPSVAIYSAGENNSYGHPSAEVVSLIQNAGIDLYGTDVNGTIIVTSDGENYTIATNKDGTVSPGEEPASAPPAEEKSEADEGETEEEAVEETPSNSSCVNINNASFEEVQGIIHIGPERAQDLIDLRPYDSVDQLSRISGIGPARITDIKNEGLACT
ncbi:MBL fold metallo-hydrolase [Oceanobacillus damuensis]|uniref:MBL fold metallo-hydrolase n=1 Tax=Oceanobacillus damuensis TaxID=937928 RepID=UPI000A0456D9|nr:MBL fold metallo-hydrolase [Oceanobacillus damuensis]